MTLQLAVGQSTEDTISEADSNSGQKPPQICVNISRALMTPRRLPRRAMALPAHGTATARKSMDMVFWETQLKHILSMQKLTQCLNAIALCR